jgi:uroporphyrinogen decarboxylase
VKIIFEHCKSLGKHTWLHSCGDNSPIVGDLIECGLDVYHPFQPEAQDINALKREYGKDITFCGGLSTQQLLPHGTPEEIRAETRRLCEEMGKGGGYILQTAKEILPDVPLENSLACIEAVTEQNW